MSNLSILSPTAPPSDSNSTAIMGRPSRTSSSASSLKDRLLALACPAKHYDWGKIGSDSLAGRLASANNRVAIEETKAYAEFWMGTHPNGPSCIRGLGMRLDEVLQAPLPFLLKVLSVKKALSIQAHPDAELAKLLHARDPAHYPDDQHKPEMAIALTPFEALCGFLPLCHIIGHIEHVNSWALFIGPETLSNLTQCHLEYARLADAGKDLFGQHPSAWHSNADHHSARALVNERVQALLSAIVRKISSLAPESAKRILDDTNSELARRTDIKPCESIFFRLYQDFPGDPGALFVFLLNHFTLDPGRAIFLAANEPHAYLAGDCVEVMAASDNVVRAGLTSKFKDAETLISMLTFRCSAKDRFVVEPAFVDDCRFSMLYAPPKHIKDFAVIYSDIRADCAEPLYSLPSVPSPSILLCTQGHGSLRRSAILSGGHSAPSFPSPSRSSALEQDRANGHDGDDSDMVSIYPGQVVYIPANATVLLLPRSESSIVFYRAFRPVD